MKKLIVGLGNPGVKYQNTRHNTGFIIVDEIVKSIGGQWKFQAKFNSDIAEIGDLIFLKPQTFMNLSGSSVSKAVSFYKIDCERVIVIHDDVDIEEGKAKYVIGGGAAGHKGVADTIEKLGTPAFKRVRVGISRPEKSTYELEDWVLGKLTEREYTKIINLVPEIKETISNP